MGQVAVRLMGEEQDIRSFVKAIEKIFGPLLVQGPRPNYRGDAGVRCYLTITINQKPKQKLKIGPIGGPI